MDASTVHHEVIDDLQLVRPPINVDLGVQQEDQIEEAQQSETADL